MPSLEHFTMKKRSMCPESLGTVRTVTLDAREIVSTRRFLTIHRLEGRRRRGGSITPDLIEIAGVFFCIDGHHKIRRAADRGESILCRVLLTEDPKLAEIFSSMSHVLIYLLLIESR